jgi:hypothetical protein
MNKAQLEYDILEVELRMKTAHHKAIIVVTCMVVIGVFTAYVLIQQATVFDMIMVSIVPLLGYIFFGYVLWVIWKEIYQCQEDLASLEAKLKLVLYNHIFKVV